MGMGMGMAHSSSNMSFMSSDSQGGGPETSEEDLIALQEDIGRWGNPRNILVIYDIYDTPSQSTVNTHSP